MKLIHLYVKKFKDLILLCVLLEFVQISFIKWFEVTCQSTDDRTENKNQVMKFYCHLHAHDIEIIAL